MMRYAQRAEGWLEAAFHPQGFNVGLESGRTGAQVVMHVIPRWAGDANFMTVIGETRVLPEELGVTAKRLKPIFERLARE